MLALSLLESGSGIVNEGDATDLPISPHAGLPVMESTPAEQMAWAPDAGMLWMPGPFDPSAVPDAGVGNPDGGGADAGLTLEKVPDACVPIAERIAHRKEFLSGVWIKSQMVGWEKAAQAYCEQHLSDSECTRPPVAVERDVGEVISDDPDGPGPEADAWLVRWEHELVSCKASQPAASPTSRHAKRSSTAAHGP
jgi:hypothetical protein